MNNTTRKEKEIAQIQKRLDVSVETATFIHGQATDVTIGDVVDQTGKVLIGKQISEIDDD